jgi:membrane-associated protein
VFDSLTQYVTDSAWTYLLLFAFALLDSVIPLVPSETAVILAGVLAADGRLQLGYVILAAALGAVAGDNIAYAIGRWARPWIERRFRSDKARARLAWAERLLRRRGIVLVVMARFIPGGRTAVTISAGMLRMNRAAFLVATVVAGSLWACYGALLGYFGGKAFEEEPWKGFVLAFGIALGVSMLVETVRWRLRRRRHATATTG